ncbi:MAG: type II toxin-antitoxin system PemK/MazF family toxin [Candidatus Dormibacteria bacterium]
MEVNLDPVRGHEQAGRRPALVVSFEPLHRYGLFTVLPITASRQTARWPGDIPVPSTTGRLTRPSVIIGSQPRTVARERLTPRSLRPETGDYLTDPLVRRQVRQVLAHQLGLDLRPGLDGAAEAETPGPTPTS